jgi:hypothetical protein
MEDVTPEADPQILTVPGFECPALYYTWLITGEDKYIVYHGNVDYTWEVTKKEWETEQTKLAGWLTAICALIGHRFHNPYPEFNDPYFTGPSTRAGKQ